MKKLLLLSMLLLISMNASAARFAIYNANVEHVRIIFKICINEECTVREAEGTHGETPIFQINREILPGQVIEMIGLMGYLNHSITPIKFGEPHCRKRLTDNRQRGFLNLGVTQSGRGLFCFGA